MSQPNIPDPVVTPPASMPDAPNGGGIKGFLSEQTAGIPNWGWLIVLAAGIGAAIFLPRVVQRIQANNAGTGTGTANPGGLGLAIDPTTGLPYAVEGLSPSGGLQGANGATAGNLDLSSTNNLLQQIIGMLTPKPVTKPPVKPPIIPGPGGGHLPPPVPGPIQPKGHGPTQPVLSRFVTVATWPHPLSTLDDIARQYGVSLQRLEQLNPGIHNPNLIHPGEQVRVA